MKRYKPLFERRMHSFKAWFSPITNYFKQFSTNGLHTEIAEQELHMNEIEAIKHGYARIFVGNEIDIDTWTAPSDREFNAIKYIIQDNSYKKFEGTRWSIYTKRGFWFFPKQSFFFADSFNDALYKPL